MSEISKKDYDCELIQDLLPLYHDGICSKSSQKIVEEHLKDCSRCRIMAENLEKNNVDEILIQEKNNILKTHKKRERKKTFTVGIVTAGVLMIPVIVSLICNLAIGHALDWFFIVLASMLLTASLTVVPLTVEKEKGMWTILTSVGSLLLLLLVCCIYTHGDWFLVAAASCILGISIFLAPYLVYHIPLPPFLADKKGLLVMVWDTLWLYIVIIVCGIYMGEDAFYWRMSLSTAFYALLLPWFIFIAVRYFKMHPLTKTGLSVIAFGFYTAFANDAAAFLSGYHVDRSIFQADLRKGFPASDIEILNANIFVMILIVSVVLGALLVWAGHVRSKKE